jgi:hypothetical protein
MRRSRSRWLNGPVVAVFAGFLSLVTAQVRADLATIHAEPVRILVADGQFGGCMVQITVDPQSVLPNCGSAWVSLSCDGTFIPKDVSSRMLEQAQLAFALGKHITVFVDDSRRHNGYCLAHRLDVW